MSPKNFDNEKNKWKLKRFYIFLFLPLHFIRYYSIPKFKKIINNKAIVKCNIKDNILEIEELIISNNLAPNLVLHMYLDGFNIDNNYFKSTIDNIRFKWVGIRFFPSNQDAQLQNLFKGIAYLNAAKDNYSDNNDRIKTIFLPDVANIKLDDSIESIQLIRERAGSRKIVLLAGLIDIRKNIKLWFKLVKTADPRKFYFLQIGEIDFKQLSMIEYFLICKLLLQTPENLTIIPHFIEDESSFNNYFKLADIIFAIYKEFKFSSGILSKAAAFHKPILVSNKYEMGKFVDQFKIGFTVDEDNSELAIMAMEKIINQNFLSNNFDLYNIKNSKKILTQILINFCFDLSKGN